MLRKICNVISGLLAVVLLALAGVLIVPYLMGYTYVKEVEPETLQVGDVVTYRLDSDTMVTHRVVEIDPDAQTLTTQGDANSDPDGAITFDRLVGKMDFYIPYLGYISLNIRTPIGIMSICGALIFIILLAFIPEIFSKDEEESKDKPAKELPPDGKE